MKGIYKTLSTNITNIDSLYLKRLINIKYIYQMVSRKELRKIHKYFCKQYSYKEICLMLAKKLGVEMSLRTLERILQKNNLRRKNIQESDRMHIAAAILIELEGSGCNLGYRAMTQRLCKVYKLTVKQKTVLKMLREIDPEGVAGRLRHRLKRRAYNIKGPNELWGCDGHDKLKRYGFAIHGCIDVWSRKLMWLTAATSNNNPEIIGYYYLQAIKKYKCLPSILRSDFGTENTLIKDLQQALRSGHDDANSGEKSFLLGKSTHNQRIESFWRQLKRLMGSFYMNLFKTMMDNGILDIKNPMHIECLRFSFGELVQQDLYNVRKEWNDHRIRNQNSLNIRGGKPNILFNCPERFGGVDCKKSVLMEHIELLEKNYIHVTPKLYDPQMDEFVKLLMPNFIKPVTAEDAYELYCDLTEKITSITKDSHEDCS